MKNENKDSKETNKLFIEFEKLIPLLKVQNISALNNFQILTQIKYTTMKKKI